MRLSPFPFYAFSGVLQNNAAVFQLITDLICSCKVLCLFRIGTLPDEGFNVRIQQFLFRNLFDDLAMFDHKSLSDTSCHAKICFACLSGTIYHTSHDCHFYVKGILLNQIFYFSSQ